MKKVQKEVLEDIESHTQYLGCTFYLLKDPEEGGYLIEHSYFDNCSFRSEALIAPKNCYFVNCSFPQKVRLDFSEQKLKEIPKYLFSLPPDSFEWLDFYYNEITEVPAGISYFSTLKGLRLSYNPIQLFPESICELSLLENLIVWGNHQVQFPKNIDRLKELKHLDFRAGSITTFPKKVFRLKKLELLSLGYHNIVEIPTDIFLLSSLKYLDLSHNKLKRLPETISLLKRLKVLSLVGNPISTEEQNRIMLYLPNCKIFFYHNEELHRFFYG